MSTVNSRRDTPVPIVAEQGDLTHVIEAARQSMSPTAFDIASSSGEHVETRLYALGAGGGIELLDTINVEKFNEYPSSKSGLLKVETPEAAVTYARRHIDPDASTLWLEIDDGRVTVVLNDHENTSSLPGWADHQVTMQLKRSPEWLAWSQLSGKLIEQSELARFLEEHILEVIDPDGSTLIEVTQTFHATQGVTFKSSQQLHSGEQRLVWEEDLQATAGIGKHVDIPTDLTIRLRPWLGVDPIDLAAKFRFRISSGQLRLAVELLRMEETSRAAVEKAAAAIGSELQLDPIQGTPPAPRR